MKPSFVAYECENCGYFEEAECITPISNVDIWNFYAGLPLLCRNVFGKNVSVGLAIIG